MTKHWLTSKILYISMEKKKQNFFVSLVKMENEKSKRSIYAQMVAITC